MACASLLPLSRSGLNNRGNLHTQYWCSLVNILGEEGHYCVKILLIIILAFPYCRMLFNRYQTFDPGSRLWYPYSIRLPKIKWYLTSWATYFSQFHAFFPLSYVDICNTNSASDAVTFMQFLPYHLE